MLKSCDLMPVVGRLVGDMTSLTFTAPKFLAHVASRESSPHPPWQLCLSRCMRQGAQTQHVPKLTSILQDPVSDVTWQGAACCTMVSLWQTRLHTPPPMLQAATLLVGGPGGPEGPGGPCVPVRPSGPRSPLSPCRPRSPAGPCGPIRLAVSPTHWPLTSITGRPMTAMLPATSSCVWGLGVPTPILPASSMRRRSAPLVSNVIGIPASLEPRVNFRWPVAWSASTATRPVPSVTAGGGAVPPIGAISILSLCALSRSSARARDGWSGLIEPEPTPGLRGGNPMPGKKCTSLCSNTVGGCSPAPVPLTSSVAWGACVPMPTLPVAGSTLMPCCPDTLGIHKHPVRAPKSTDLRIWATLSLLF